MSSGIAEDSTLYDRHLFLQAYREKASRMPRACSEAI